MASPARPEQTKSARSSRQLSRFCYLINPDKVFGTHSGIEGNSGFEKLFLYVSRQVGPKLKGRVTQQAFELAGNVVHIPSLSALCAVRFVSPCMAALGHSTGSPTTMLPSATSNGKATK